MVMPRASQRRRQGVDQRRAQAGDPAPRSRDRQVRVDRAVQDHAEGRPAFALRHGSADAQNNLYFMDFGDENIGRIDAKTGQSTIYPTPTPHSRPRRTMMDQQGRVWFAEFAANKLGCSTPRRRSFKEWDVPTPHTYPYDVFLDRNGELWSGSMSSDRVLRLDPQTGQLGRISAAAPDQHPARLRRQLDQPVDVLGRQQSRRRDRARRAARLEFCSRPQDRAPACATCMMRKPHVAEVAGATRWRATLCDRSRRPVVAYQLRTDRKDFIAHAVVAIACGICSAGCCSALGRTTLTHALQVDRVSPGAFCIGNFAGAAGCPPRWS